MNARRATVSAAAPDPDLAAWARQVIADGRAEHGAPLPLYEDTPAWHALPRATRWATVAVAAETQRISRSPKQVAVDMAEALLDEDESMRRRLRLTSWDIASAPEWQRVPAATFAELQRRRYPWLERWSA